MKKLDRFIKGWNEQAFDLVMPDAVYDKVTGTFKTWEEMLEPLTLFEAYRLGQIEGLKYARATKGG